MPNTPTQDDIDRQLERLEAERARLADLLLQESTLGAAYVPPGVPSGIRQARAAIRHIKAALRAWDVVVDDQLDDEAPPAAASAVQTRLADLPLDTIPDPATLPPGSRMPFARNPLFVGRTDELKAIARALCGGPSVAATVAAIGQIAAATGMGGIGKSNLAAEFVHRYGQYFRGGVFWLSFADPAGVPAEVAACGAPGAMDLPGFSALATDDQVSRVRQEWQLSLPRLLVFDNCEDEQLLARWRPISGGAHVLVTARRAEWDPVLGVQRLSLDVLPRARSVELLRKFRPDLPVDDPDLAAIAAELGDLPLALHLAGSFLKQYRTDISPAAYLAELRDASLLDHESLQGIDLTLSPTNHTLHVGRTFSLSYDQLQAADPIDALALALLTRAACFAPGEPIPRDLLLATCDLPNTATLRRASRAVKRLVDLGLLDEEPNSALTLHRLLATFAQRQIADADALGAVEQALVDTSYDLVRAGLPASLVPLQAHLRYLAEPALGRADTRASDLCIVMARYLRLIGNYAAALPYAKRALVIDEEELERGESIIATDLLDVAGLLKDQGDYQAARPLYERALTIREQALGPEHPSTASSLNNLASLLQDQGDYQAARPLFERALAISVARLGANHPIASTIQNNLAALDTPQRTAEQQIAEITQQADADVAQALAGATAAARANLASRLEQRAQWAENGEAEGSPYLALAAHLRALAAQLAAPPHLPAPSDET